MRGICFIGAGKMATAIAGGMVRKNIKTERRSPPLSPHSKTPTRFSLPSNRST